MATVVGWSLDIIGGNGDFKFAYSIWWINLSADCSRGMWFLYDDLLCYGTIGASASCVDVTHGLLNRVVDSNDQSILSTSPAGWLIYVDDRYDCVVYADIIVAISTFYRLNCIG